MGPSLAENQATAHESRRCIWGPSLAGNRSKTDPEIPGQAAFRYPVNEPGRPILRPTIRQAVPWVVGPSLAGNRPTARRAPSMGFGTKSTRKSTEHRAKNSRPDCLQLPSKSARQTNSIRPASQQACSLVVGPSLAENRATAHESRRWVLGPSLTKNLRNADK